MSRHIFIGKIYPERAWLSLPTIDFSAMTRNESDIFECKIAITLNTVTALVQTHDDSISLLSLKNTIQLLTDRIVSIHDYLKGFTHHVEISQHIDEDGNTTLFGVNENSIASRLNINDSDFDNIISLLMKKEYFLLLSGLTDLTKAIKYPHDTPFFCFRALESIIQHLKATGLNEASAWKELSTISGQQPQDIKQLKTYANSSRHGYHYDLTGEQREGMLKTSFLITDKMINYILDQENRHPSLNIISMLPQHN